MSGMTTRVKLPPDFTATLKALLATPPPPPGDPSTRKIVKKKRKARTRSKK
jgi:hypothetical protein